MMALSAAQDLLRQLVEAIPVAWRQDGIFRVAATGAGITAVLLLLRVAGPHGSLSSPATIDLGPASVPTLPASHPPLSPPLPPPTIAKIAPGHALGDVIIVPAPDGDRFGVAPPASRK
jgi:hypothetical protein